MGALRCDLVCSNLLPMLPFGVICEIGCKEAKGRWPAAPPNGGPGRRSRATGVEGQTTDNAYKTDQGWQEQCQPRCAPHATGPPPARRHRTCTVRSGTRPSKRTAASRRSSKMCWALARSLRRSNGAARERPTSSSKRTTGACAHVRAAAMQWPVQAVMCAFVCVCMRALASHARVCACVHARVRCAG